MDTAFIAHLSKSGLAREHAHYLAALAPDSDTTNYFRSKFHLQYFNDSLFLHYYFKSKALCDDDRSLLAAASSAFLNNYSSRTRIWFESAKPASKNQELNDLQNIYSCSVNPNLYTTENFPESIRPSYKKYKQAYNRKASVAGALSVIVPGLGKLYAGKSRSFVMTFVLNAAYAAQTAESVKKLGWSHPLSIINAGAFGVFYLSNIYGSYKAVVQQRKEYKKQFLTDAARYHH